MVRIWKLLLWCGMGFFALVMAQNVFASSYTIEDGSRTYHYTGFATDARVVLEKAGVTLAEADSYTHQAGTITVQRAPRVQVSYHGQSFCVDVREETAQALLARLGLDIAQGDVLNMPRQTLLQDGMYLQVDQILTRQESYTSCIPYETRQCAAPELPEGTRQVLVEGRDGTLATTAWVTYSNGREIQREILEQKQTQPPVTQIIAIGTGDPPRKQTEPVIGDGKILLPTGETLTYYKVDYVRATAYTHTDAGCTMTTATGTTVHRGTVAVDPRYIPYGTRMFIVASDGSYLYGIAQAEDCGGDIKGDRMDLYLPSYEECIRFGRRRCTVYFLGE